MTLVNRFRDDVARGAQSAPAPRPADASGGYWRRLLGHVLALLGTLGLLVIPFVVLGVSFSFVVVGFFTLPIW